MKKLALATAAVLALLSIAGCANVGKGKAPPRSDEGLSYTAKVWGKGRLRAGPFLFWACKTESSANFFPTQGLISRYRGILEGSRKAVSATNASTPGLST